MMNRSMILAATALAIALATPAVSAEINKDGAMDRVGQKAEKGWNDAKESVSDLAADIKFSVLSNENKNPKFDQKTISGRYTAEGLIGSSIKNANGDTVGRIDDIVVDRAGKAQYVVVSEASFLKVADKLAAFPYSSIVAQEKDGDVIMPLTEKMIEGARPFTYDPRETKEGKISIAPSSLRVSKLMDAEVMDPRKAVDADVENITFRNGKIDYVVFDIDEKRGMTDDRAAVSFGNLEVSPVAENDAEFRLSAAQSKSFESHLASVD